MEHHIKQYADLLTRAKAILHATKGIQAPDSLAALECANQAAVVGQDFITWSVGLKQSARRCADAEVLRRG